MPVPEHDHDRPPLPVNALHEHLVLGDLVWDFRQSYGAVGYKRPLPSQILEEHVRGLLDV